MKTGLITINQAIAILEKAKREHGGKRRVRIYGGHGDVVAPKSMSEGSTMRGHLHFEWVAFSEEDQP